MTSWALAPLLLDPAGFDVSLSSQQAALGREIGGAPRRSQGRLRTAGRTPAAPTAGPRRRSLAAMRNDQPPASSLSGSTTAIDQQAAGTANFTGKPQQNQSSPKTDRSQHPSHHRLPVTARANQPALAPEQAGRPSRSPSSSSKPPSATQGHKRHPMNHPPTNQQPTTAAKAFSITSLSRIGGDLVNRPRMVCQQTECARTTGPSNPTAPTSSLHDNMAVNGAGRLSR